MLLWEKSLKEITTKDLCMMSVFKVKGTFVI